MMTNRRAIIKWDIRVLKERLFLPGKIIGMRIDPFDAGIVEIKLEGEDLPERKEGEMLPRITIDINDIPAGEIERVMKEYAFWTTGDGVTKHRIIL